MNTKYLRIVLLCTIPNLELFNRVWVGLIMGDEEGIPFELKSYLSIDKYNTYIIQNKALKLLAPSRNRECSTKLFT